MNKNSAVKISIVTAITIAVADMVGIGVFTSLGWQVLGGITSGFSIIALWTLGGLVALCGALCYAELATMFPRSGGEYNFLSRTYHPAVGFMSGWLSATVGFAAPIAVAAMAFGGYFKGAIPEVNSVSETIKTATGGTITDGVPLILGLGLVWLVTALQLRGVKNSSLFQNVSTIIKIGLILALIVFGFTTATPQPTSFIPSNVDFAQIFGVSFAISLVYVMFSYSGWNASTYIIDEVKEPEKTLPKAMLIATVVVTVLYVTLNAVFMYVTPIEAMTFTTDSGIKLAKNEIALVAGQYIFGDVGSKILAGLICFGLISTVSAMIWIGSRVTMVMGEDLPLLSVFSFKNNAGVPAIALLTQALIVTGLICTQSFDGIIKYISFSILVSSFATVLGVIVLRYTQPDLPRPYKTWLYPVTPIIFLAVTLFMMGYMLYDENSRMQSLAGLATIFSGLIVYYINVFSTKSKLSTEPLRETS
ncbi:MAG: APC family permease [Methyloligellaceae bacterium]